MSISSSSSRRSTTVNPLQLENQSLRDEISALQKLFSLPTVEKQRWKQLRYHIYTLEKQVALLTRLLNVKQL